MVVYVFIYITLSLSLSLSNIHYHDGAARSWAWTWVAGDDKSTYCKKDYEGELTTLSYIYIYVVLVWCVVYVTTIIALLMMKNLTSSFYQTQLLASDLEATENEMKEV